MAFRNHKVGKAQHRNRSSRLEARTLHTVRKMLDNLPACGNPRKVLSDGTFEGRSRNFQERSLPQQGQSELLFHHSGCGRRLHGLRLVRIGMPRKEPYGRRRKGVEYDRARTYPRKGTRQFRVLLEFAESRPASTFPTRLCSRTITSMPAAA